MSSHDVNTVLLVILLPVVGFLGRVLWRMDNTLREIKTVISGFEGQGGVQRSVEALSARVLVLEHAVSAIGAERTEPSKGRR